MIPTSCIQRGSQRGSVAASHRKALDHFADALHGHGTIGPDLSEALKAQAVAEAATRSPTIGRLEEIRYLR
jgi:myo-inositol 2-dehydrogenase / D-chiro-inositol 1-dehydrogenase